VITAGGQKDTVRVLRLGVLRLQGDHAFPFPEGSRHGRLHRGREGGQRQRPKSPRGVDPYDADGIIGRGEERLPAVLVARTQLGERPNRAEAREGIPASRRAHQRFAHLGPIAELRQQPRGAGAMDRIPAPRQTLLQGPNTRRIAPAALRDGHGETEPGLALLTCAEPVLHLRRRPRRIPLGVAPIAGTRDAERPRPLRIRKRKAVVVAGIALHVDGDRHVAGDARRPGPVGIMVRVGGGPQARIMAAEAEVVAFGAQARAMRLMAGGAPDAALILRALEKGAPFVGLTEQLSVWVILGAVEEDGLEVIEEGRSRAEARGDVAAERVTGRAEIEELVARERAVRVVARRGPRAVSGHVGGARPVAGLARHAQLRPARLVLVRCRGVALLVPGCVAVEALRVGGHPAVGPVAPVRWLAWIAREDVEPLAAGGIERDRQRLQPPAGERDEVLLERRPPERVRGEVAGGLAAPEHDVDHEAVALALRDCVPRGRPGDTRAIKRCVHVRRDRRAHGRRMQRIAPRPLLHVVARGAGGRADVVRPRVKVPGRTFHGTRDCQGRHGAENEVEPALALRWYLRGSRWRPDTRVS